MAHFLISQFTPVYRLNPREIRTQPDFARND